MKRRRIFSILICISLITVMIFTGCSKKASTLEEFVNNDKEVTEEINELSTETGLQYNITGNDVVYTYDLKNYEGMTEEMAANEEFKNTLNTELESTAENFADLCEDLEEESKIEGIRIVVSYTYGDEVIASATFDKNGIVK